MCSAQFFDFSFNAKSNVCVNKFQVPIFICICEYCKCLYSCTYMKQFLIINLCIFIADTDFCFKS